jgi:hypothetical protein
MIETEIKKLTEALIENARLLQAHIDLRKDNNPDGTAKCSGKDTSEEEADAKVLADEDNAAEAEEDETTKLIDKANAREEKKREAKAAKKAEAAAAAKEKEEAEASEPAPDGELTHEDVREYIVGVRKDLKTEDGPKAASQHRKDTKDLMEEGGYESLSKIPLDELADFLEDVKALAE